MNWYTEGLMKHPKFHSKDRVGREGLDTLYPPFRVVVLIMETLIAQAKLPFELYETYRSAERQVHMYNTGVSKLRTGGIHTYGCAVDFVPKVNGKWTWDVPREQWLQLGQIGKSLGLCWGGDWKTLVDCPHFQCVSVAGQAALYKGDYPKIESAGKIAVPTDTELKERQLIVNALKDVYNHLEGANLSQSTRGLLNTLRYSVELKDIKPTEAKAPTKKAAPKSK